MEEFKYRNRYGKDITFTYQGDGSSVVMSGGDYMRFGEDDKGNISFADPSGGPFVFVGMDFTDLMHNGRLKPFLDDPFTRRITKITNDLMGITITFNKVPKEKPVKEKKTRKKKDDNRG